MNYQHNNNAGRLNKRVTFYNPPGEIVDGWPSLEWTKAITVWAEIKTNKGTRLFNSDATQWQDKKIVGIRFRKGINRQMRLEIAGKMYEIESLTNDDERDQWYTIIVKEVL